MLGFSRTSPQYPPQEPPQVIPQEPQQQSPPQPLQQSYPQFYPQPYQEPYSQPYQKPYSHPCQEDYLQSYPEPDREYQYNQQYGTPDSSHPPFPCCYGSPGYQNTTPASRNIRPDDGTIGCCLSFLATIIFCCCAQGVKEECTNC